MMTLHERLHPDIPALQRLPFVGSFPMNPRPFLSGKATTGSEDSLMLAFSDGITLPFLPSDLPLEGRFKLLGRQAHRQLKSFQKRKRTEAEELALGTKGPKFLLPTFYLASQDRWKMRWASVGREDSLGFANVNFQGAYPAAIPQTLATCGISSVGDRTALISSGKYSLDVRDMQKEGKDVAADFRNMWSFVRPRDGEFLVGAAGNRDNEGGEMSLGFGVSFDGNAIDPEMAKEWKEVIEGLLEPDASTEGRKRETKL